MIRGTLLHARPAIPLCEAQIIVATIFGICAAVMLGDDIGRHL